MKLSANIPVPTYLAKYFYWKERQPFGSLLSLDYTMGDAPYILAGILTGKASAQHFEPDDMRNEKLDSYVSFEISPRKFHYGKIVISEEGANYFANFLRKNLHELLFDRIVRGVENEEQIKDIIYGFMDELDVNEDVDFGTLKKAQDRLRKRKKMPPFSPRNRPLVA